MKKADIVVILAALILGLGLLLLPKSPGGTVTVISNGKTVGTYELDTDRKLELDGNVVEIFQGKVRMTAADCPGGDCLAAAPISRAGESIACLPNRLILRIDGKKTEGPDAMTGGVGG